MHSKSTNFAVFSELGQFPMLISVIARCINFWIHTIQSSNESLLSEAYWEQCNNPVLKSSWLSFVKNVITDLRFSHVWNNQSTFNASALLTCIKTKLKERFISFWGLKINSTIGMDKLRTYRLSTQQFGFEKYLEVLPDRKIRKALAAFRISAHKLQIERGRYSGQNLEDRLCSACNVVQDEVHLFCDCIEDLTPRNQFLQIFNGQNTNNAVSNKDHFINLMSSTDENTLKSIGLFISACNIS